MLIYVRALFQPRVVYDSLFSLCTPLPGCAVISLKHQFANRLNSGARDEEPLVNAWVNGRGSLAVALGDVELAGLGAIC